MPTPASISSAHVEVYEEFGGDSDMYQRRGMPKGEALGDIWAAWSTIDDIRRRLYLVVAGLASAHFAASVEADFVSCIPDENARRRVRDIVDRDIQLRK